MFKKVGRDIMIKVLLVEDNIDIADNIYEYLKDEVDMSCAYDGIDAIYKIDTFNFDIIILDLMLPEVSGMEVLKHIRDKQLNLGVLVLTAKEALGDKLKAFNLGANDYLTKPFYMEELKARIFSILRSLGKIKSSNIIEFKDMQLDMKAKKVFIKSEDLKLNEKLYELTELLVKNRGMVLFKEQIFDNICGYNSDASTEIIEVYMSRLRKQLNKFGYDKFIVTKRGIGYLLDENIEE